MEPRESSRREGARGMRGRQLRAAAGSEGAPAAAAWPIRVEKSDLLKPHHLASINRTDGLFHSSVSRSFPTGD